MAAIDEAVRYEDSLIVSEIGGGYGEYMCSYRYDDGLIEVHLFRKREGTWTAFLTKSPGVPMDDAQTFADDAYRREAKRGERVKIVMDPYSLPRTGSF